MVTKAAWLSCHTLNVPWPTSWRDSPGQSVQYLSLYFRHWFWRLLVWLLSISNLWGYLKCPGFGKPHLKTLKCFPIVPVKSPPKQPPGYKFHIHVGHFKVIKCPTLLGKLQSLCVLCQYTMKPQPFPLKSSNPPLSPYQLQDIHVSCETEAKVQMPQP